MKVVLNTDYAKQDGAGEMHHGEFVPCFENPSRLQNIIETFKENGVRDFVEPKDFGLGTILKVHDPDYVNFLQNIWKEWRDAGNTADIMPYVWPLGGLKRRTDHQNLNAKVGSYAFSSDTPIMAGTWQATYQGVQSTLTALDLVHQGERAAFALTRPPGHHAHADLYGGYCLLNNVAVAAQKARDLGYEKVCVLDVDFHHGNGTQDIFYERDDVLTVSLHGHPDTNFPYFLGYEDETGEGKGEGYNLNIALKNGTDFAQWSKALGQALEKIKNFGADFLIIALGVDTYEEDPISQFKLKTHDYLQMGAMIETLKLPTVFSMEGGYDIGPIGQNVYNVLAGFDG